MKVKEILKLIRCESEEISIREDNCFRFKTRVECFPKEYLDREIIDIIPNFDIPDIEQNCFVINIK